MNSRSLAIVVGAAVAALTMSACASDAGPDEPVAGGSAALEGCVPTTLTGVDVSYHNDTVSWSKVKAAGRSFAFARTSDGLTDLDDQFATNWKAMKAAGLVRGAYQFFRARHGGVELADLMVKQISDAGGLKVGDLPPVLDFETLDDQSAATAVSRAKDWIARIQTKLGVKPIVYTGNNMSDAIGTNFKDYELWVAHYEVDCPRIPAGWRTWTFWQSSETGAVNGIAGHSVDLDFFQGKASDLAAITIQHAVSLAPEDVSPLPEGATFGGGNVMGDGQRGLLE
jgi:lysozyme